MGWVVNAVIRPSYPTERRKLGGQLFPIMPTMYMNYIFISSYWILCNIVVGNIREKIKCRLNYRHFVRRW